MIPAIRGNINNEVGRNKMAKSRRKKNYKLRKRVMRTVAALTMIMAIVVAAIPVENYGTMRAADGKELGDITTDLDNANAHYSNSYETGYTTSGIVQRIREDANGTLSLVDLFEIKKNNSGNAIITKDIIGDGDHKGETELTVNQIEYCNYVQFDTDFINAVKNGLASGSFELTFPQETLISLTVPASLNSGTTPITVKTVKKDGFSKNTVSPSISIGTNPNAQGYTDFGAVNLDSGNMYSQDFGKALYDAKIAEIDDYNARVNAFVTKVNAFIAKVSAAGYTWDTNNDTNEWNSYVTEANGFDSNSTAKLSKAYTDFANVENGLNGIVDYVIRNHCKKGNNDLTQYRLRSLLRPNTSGDVEPVYVPQYTGAGDFTWLDENNFLPATADSKVTIKGIASHDNTNNAFYGTTLNKITLPQGLQFIGKQAFGSSNLTEVTINTTVCEIIGEEAFAECTSLAKVNFSFSGEVDSKKFITIDKKAFYKTAIKDVTIPAPVTMIGAGAFAGVRALQTVTFEDTGRGSDIAIEKYAFYDCDGLTEVKFPENNQSQYKIGKGVFALSSVGGSLNSFNFPGGNTDVNYGTADDYDFILANRNTLKEVTFPGKLKSDVPDNTLTNCHNLSWVKFPEGAQNAGYNPVKLFADVWGNPGFYVEGPELLNQPGSRSKPRETTWAAKAGKTGTTSDNPLKDIWALPSVPYKFTDSTGKVHFEMGVSDENGDLQYIANLQEIDGNNASLVSYFPYKKDAVVKEAWITIPTTVGGYNVVSIEPGCFDGAKELKDNITRLTIGDSVTDIKAGAFKAMPALQWVDIGSGVRNIESEAFAECSELQNVVFSQTLTGTFPEESEYWQDLQIASDAFKTNSDRLTFHGAVNPEYAPFKMAMSPNNSDLLKKDTQICYKTDAPLNLTVIRNRKDGKATLVNYPHYEDMDDEIVKAFEAVYIDDNATDEEKNKLDSEAGRAIMQTLHMNLPSGIESIDSKAFFAPESKNDLDFEYIDHYYNQKYPDSQTISQFTWEVADKKVNAGDSNANDLKSLYSQDGYNYVVDSGYAEAIGDTAYTNNDSVHNPDKQIVSTGGLFSGGFDEAKKSIDTDSAIWEKPYENQTYLENYKSGNDYLTSIDMRGVKDLPKYAFDSCENLLTVGFSAVESMGDLPFRGCKNLYSINPGNTKYVFQNMLLYETKQDGSYEIVQCLEGRGAGQKDNGHYYYTGSVTSKGEEGAENTNVDSNLANVTSIRTGAFSNCDEITEVNLEDSKITKIPQRAFENCKGLFQVTLPETTMGIDQKAFKGAADKRNLYVTIKNPNCTIAVDAFDFDTTKEVFIKGISTDDKGGESICHYNYNQIKEELNKSGKDGNRIHFSELGRTCLLTFVDDKFNVIDTIEIDKGTTLKNPPTAPLKTGYKFDQWICTNVRGEDGKPLMGAATYTDVTEDRTIMANYVEDPTTIVPDGKDYNLTVANGNAMIGGTLVTTFPTTVKGGTSVTIMANDATNFKVWTIEPGTYIALLLNPSSPATSFTMPNADITVTANTAIGGGTDTPNPDGTYKVTVNNGTGSGNYRPGATVTITANTPPAGQTFVNWTTTTADVKFASATTATTTFVMPAANVNVTANFSGGNGGNNNNPGGDGNNPGGSDSGKKYKVTVNYGSGSGEYAAGATVNITANAPESSSRVFSRWTTNNSGLGFANANSVSTSFVMPAADVTVTANYKTRSSDDDDDDDDGPSRRPGTNTSTSTVPNRPSSSTSTTGTNGTVNNTTNGTTNNGNKIYITKNGISNTDVASLAVSGSTDNFIVRITESPEATAAVEQSLTNTYGSLNGLAYLPMDISLYDSTGQNKITDSTGLNITVTMPIPDVLIQYGGNARVAAADNGNLQQITPRFTTIDGIACVSFVPPHFSPYVIYVDTNNLIAGQMLDSTPATGDPIHPKWFAAIGMACVSILLFVLSDGRKRRKYRAA